MGWVSVAHCNRSLEGWGGCVRVVWSCTWLTFCVLVFLLGVFAIGDDLRLRNSKHLPPKNSVPETSPETSKFSSKFPLKISHTSSPETIPQKKNIKVKVTTPFDALGTYLHTPPTAQSLFGAKRGRNNHRAGPHGFFFIRLA